MFDDVPEKDKKKAYKRKRNMIAKILRDPGEHKGAFALKIVNPKKQEYKRQKLRVKDAEYFEEED